MWKATLKLGCTYFFWWVFLNVRNNKLHSLHHSQACSRNVLPTRVSKTTLSLLLVSSALLHSVLLAITFHVVELQVATSQTVKERRLYGQVCLCPPFCLINRISQPEGCIEVQVYQQLLVGKSARICLMSHSCPGDLCTCIPTYRVCEPWLKICSHI